MCKLRVKWEFTNYVNFTYNEKYQKDRLGSSEVNYRNTKTVFGNVNIYFLR